MRHEPGSRRDPALPGTWMPDSHAPDDATSRSMRALAARLRLSVMPLGTHVGVPGWQGEIGRDRHAGREPRTAHWLRWARSGGDVHRPTTFSVATSYHGKDANGQEQETTEWSRCVAWGTLAEVCAQYVGKGSRGYVAGRLHTLR